MSGIGVTSRALNSNKMWVTHTGHHRDKFCAFLENLEWKETRHHDELMI
jgi:hypothetical protein